MNPPNWLTDDLIEAAFQRRAGRAAPGDLRDGILAVTAGTRQRSRWAMRFAPTNSIMITRPAWIAIAVLAALVALVAALAMIGQRPSTPFRTGLLSYVRGGDVYLARPDGSDPEVVLHQDGVVFMTVAWSPDGSRLAIDGEAGAIVVDPATGTATFIGGTNPVWSPDGRQLAVLDPGALPVPTRLRIVEMAGGGTARTLPFPAIGGLAWSPNGRWIAATGGTSGASNSLVRIDVTTGAVTELDGPSGMLDSVRDPAWSPDSLHIAFIRWGPEGAGNCPGNPLCATDVFVANADGSDAVRLNQVRGKADLPSWSPDGRWIAFRDADRANHGGGQTTDAIATGIAMAHPDGTGQRTISADGVEAFAWGAESDRLRFIGDAGAGSAPTIREVTLDGIPQAVEVPLGPAPNLFERTGSRFAWQTLDVGRAVQALPKVFPSPGATALVAVTPAPADPADPSGTWPTVVSQSEDGCKPMTIASGTGAVATVADICDAFGASTYGWSPEGSFYAAIIDQKRHLTLARRDGSVDSQIDHLTGLAGIFWYRTRSGSASTARTAISSGRTAVASGRSRGTPHGRPMVERSALRGPTASCSSEEPMGLTSARSARFRPRSHGLPTVRASHSSATATPGRQAAMGPTSAP